MAENVVFHHAQGLTRGVVSFADTLRAAGHTVFIPDVFEGRTFDALDDAMTYVGTVGFTEIAEHAVRMADDLPADVVYIGWSLGVIPAQQLAQTRDGARGAVLIDACVPVSEFSTSWPQRVPVQIHGMDADPFFVGEGDIENARALVDEAASGEMFLYPGDQHLFADSSLASYDKDATGLLIQRVLDFLDTIR